jgi:hypothetical protein
MTPHTTSPALPAATPALPVRRQRCLPWPQALACAALALPALACAQDWTLLHSFDFSRGLSSTQGAVPSVVGHAVAEGGVLQLRGDASWLEFGPALIPTAENGFATWWSVSLWAREVQPRPNSTAVFVGQGVSQGFVPEFTLGLQRGSAGDTPAVAGINQSGWGGGISSPVATPEQWHHYAVAMRENGVLLYVDGQFAAASGPVFDYATPYYRGSTRFGRQVANEGGSFTGDLDDIRIYSGQLDAATIAAQYAAGPSPVPEPATAALMGAGALGLLAWTRRRAAARR